MAPTRLKNEICSRLLATEYKKDLQKSTVIHKPVVLC